MNRSKLDQIVQATLYEGYLLYPYRPSVKNTQRWTFGGIYPEAYHRATGGAEACEMQTECLVTGPAAAVEVSVRFLRLIERRQLAVDGAADAAPEPATWQEAGEEAATLARCRVADMLGTERVEQIRLEAQASEVDGVRREQRAIAARVIITASPVTPQVHRFGVHIRNVTPLEEPGGLGRAAASLYALASTHIVLHVNDGAFVSMTDPPPELQSAAQACRNVGSWPVLVGDEGETDTLLAAPIILYDYPKIAPESPGDLFDAFEIDEMLTLRILTLTNQEKRAAEALDPRGSALLARTEALAREQLARLHGTIRDWPPKQERRDA